MKLLKRFWTDFVRNYRWYYAAGLLCLVGTNLLTVAIPKFVENAIDALETTDGSQDASRFAFAVIICGLAIMVVRTLSRTLFFNPGRTIEFDVKLKLFERLLLQPQAYRDRHRAGDLVSRGTNDTNSMRALIGFGTLQLFNTAFVLSLTIYQMFELDSGLTALVLCPLIFGGVIMSYAVRRLFHLAQTLLKQLGQLSDRILESYSGVAVVQTYDSFDGAEQRFERLNVGFFETSVKMLKLRTLVMPLLSLFGQLSVALILYFGGQKILEPNSTMTIGKLSAFIAYVTILVSGLRSLGFLVGATQRGYLGLERVYEILSAPLERVEPQPSPSDTALTGPLQIRNLTFHYPGDEHPTLTDINLTINNGETMGIFGATGSGKSTLLSVISRIYDPQPGQIFLDNRDILDVPVDDYWRALAFARQSPFLFSQSVEENISLNALSPDDIDEARLALAVNDASLTQEIEQFPAGFKTKVGERGITLSGGQRQRTALARLFYRDFQFVLLDDVMSAVDHTTEKNLIEAIYRRDETAGRCIVSHRTSVLQHADRIIILEDGRIVDEGTHHELISREGLYQSAHLLQTREDSEAPL